MGTAKEAIEAVLNELEKELSEERIKVNRLTQELQKQKNLYAQLVDVVMKGAEICHQMQKK
jgi:nitrate reductase assembly molybdenum cofactor insertion protein NarJ